MTYPVSLRVRILCSSLSAVLLIFFVFAHTGFATFYGEVETGFQPVSSDRYGAFSYVPDSYTPEKDWPLLVILYSDEVVKGSVFIDKWLPELERKEWIVLFISFLDPKEMPQSSDERIFRLMREIRKICPIDPRRTWLAAFGEAAHYSFYLGASYPGVFSGVALAGGGAQGKFEPLFAYERKGAREIPFLVVYGDQDQTIQKEAFAVVHKKLAGRGYQIELEEFQGLGHRFYPEFQKRMMDWFEALSIVEAVSVEKSVQVGSPRQPVPYGIPQYISGWLRDMFKK